MSKKKKDKVSVPLEYCVHEEKHHMAKSHNFCPVCGGERARREWDADTWKVMELAKGLQEEQAKLKKQFSAIADFDPTDLQDLLSQFGEKLEDLERVKKASVVGMDHKTEVSTDHMNRRIDTIRSEMATAGADWRTEFDELKEQLTSLQSDVEPAFVDIRRMLRELEKAPQAQPHTGEVPEYYATLEDLEGLRSKIDSIEDQSATSDDLDASGQPTQDPDFVRRVDVLEEKIEGIRVTLLSIASQEGEEVADEGEARSFSEIISDTWQSWRNRYKEWAAQPVLAPKSDE